MSSLHRNVVNNDTLVAELNKENLLKCELIEQEKALLQVNPVLLVKHSFIIDFFTLGKSREVDRGFASK